MNGPDMAHSRVAGGHSATTGRMPRQRDSMQGGTPMAHSQHDGIADADPTGLYDGGRSMGQ